MSPCINQPVSWLRLEQFALGELPPDAREQVHSHLHECAVCASCLATIQSDDIALPELPVASPAQTRANLRWFRRPAVITTATTLLAAAAALMLWLRASESNLDYQTATATTRVKGAGEIALSVVRARPTNGADVVALDATTFRNDDRFEVAITCGAGGAVWARTVVWQADHAGQRERASTPLPTARIACGNHVILPGAFRITSAPAAHVCVTLSPDALGAAAAADPHAPIACIPLLPEK